MGRISFLAGKAGVAGHAAGGEMRHAGLTKLQDPCARILPRNSLRPIAFCAVTGLSRSLTKRDRVPQKPIQPVSAAPRWPSFLDPITRAGLRGRLANRKPAQTSNRLLVVQIPIVKTKARFIQPMLLLRMEKLPEG